MRSALLTSFCAAALCATFAVGAGAQTAPELPAAPTSLATAAIAIPDAPAMLLADNTVPAFSSSATEDLTAALPEAPAVMLVAAEGQAPNAHVPSNQPVAPKYAGTILPGQTAVPYTAGDKVVYAFRDAASPYALVSRLFSAGWSHLLDSQPHYGVNRVAFAQRFGAAYARGTVQDLATEAVFDPIFHDDPRYYVLGRGNNIVKRAVYAATRVVVTRGDNGHQRVNAPLLLGYAAAAGTNMAYYPQRDRNFGDAATGYAGSLGGGVLGFEISEFLDDALHIVHIRH